MGAERLNRLVRDELAGRRQQNLLRGRRCVRPLDSTHVLIDGKRLVNFASNNYLGLTHHPRVMEAVQESVRAYGAGGGASPLITGYTSVHAVAEQMIAQWKGAQAAVLLPSGYQSAHAAVGALAGAAAMQRGGVRFLADKLCHASLLDAVAASQAALRVYPHNQLGKLRRLLEGAPEQQLQVVLTESIFSMDGDAADLAGIAELKDSHPFFLLLDEAHASGVYGPRGAGYPAECGLTALADASIVTLSKAMGLGGGAVCGSREFCDAIVNWGRAYIYSTSIPPMMAAGAMAAIEVMRAEPERQRRVRALAGRVRGGLEKAGLRVPAGDSPIIPVILGSEEAALGAAGRLEQRGLLVLAIRPPTVPRGSSRLRITLCCDHTDAEVEELIAAVAQ